MMKNSIMKQGRIFLGKEHVQSFRLMSYNILADSLVAQDQKHLQDWEKRWTDIYEIIRQYKSDILCLQELDHNELFLTQELQKSYKLCYLKRGEERQDGCAILFNQQRFQFLQEYPLYLQQPQIDNHYLDRPNICLIVQLQDKLTNQSILVATSHLLFNTKRGDIKLLQIQIITQALKVLQEKTGASIVWCGDFNAIPHSPIYSYLRDGFYDFTEEDSQNLSGQEFAKIHLTDYMINRKKLQSIAGTYQMKKSFFSKNMQPRWAELMNRINCRLNGNQLEVFVSAINEDYDFRIKIPIKFYSAYGEVQRYYRNEAEDYYANWATYEPLMTINSCSQVGCVDYIWFNKLRVSRVLQIPHLKNLITKYPYPSDHMPLVCDLYFQ